MSTADVATTLAATAASRIAFGCPILAELRQRPKSSLVRYWRRAGLPHVEVLERRDTPAFRGYSSPYAFAFQAASVPTRLHYRGRPHEVPPGAIMLCEPGETFGFADPSSVIILLISPDVISRVGTRTLWRCEASSLADTSRARIAVRQSSEFRRMLGEISVIGEDEIVIEAKAGAALTMMAASRTAASESTSGEVLADVVEWRPQQESNLRPWL